MGRGCHDPFVATQRGPSRRPSQGTLSKEDAPAYDLAVEHLSGPGHVGGPWWTTLGLGGCLFAVVVASTSCREDPPKDDSGATDTDTSGTSAGTTDTGGIKDIPDPTSTDSIGETTDSGTTGNNGSCGDGSAAVGETCFGDPQFLLRGVQVGDLAWVDLNDDGRTDLCAATATGVYLCAAQAGGALAPCELIGPGDDAVALAVGQVDGSGPPDLVVLYGSSERMAWILASSAPQIEGELPLGFVPRSLALGPLVTGAPIDAVVGADDGSLVLARGDTALGFVVQDEATLGDTISALAVIDIDASGTPEIAAAQLGSDALLAIPTDGDILGAPILLANMLGARDLDVADLNDDSFLDLISSNADQDTVGILYGLNGGGFATPQQILIGNDPWAVEVGDYDGEGSLDLAAAVHGSNALSIRLQRDMGWFGIDSYGVLPAPSALAAFDLNADGVDDLACASSGIGGGVMVLVSNI